jgi:hypothetical protein
VCRDYAADELCDRIAAPTLDERVARYLDLFGLADEARRVAPCAVHAMFERMKRGDWPVRPA